MIGKRPAGQEARFSNFLRPFRGAYPFRISSFFVEDVTKITQYQGVFRAGSGISLNYFPLLARVE
jgi:hypothetical protein